MGECRRDEEEEEWMGRLVRKGSRKKKNFLVARQA
jgi:hypothetical protein